MTDDSSMIFYYQQSHAFTDYAKSTRVGPMGSGLASLSGHSPDLTTQVVLTVNKVCGKDNLLLHMKFVICLHGILLSR